MTLPFPPRDCACCLESLALDGRPIALVVPCGHCVHKCCFDARRAECTKDNRAITCPCNKQVVVRQNECFFFESDSDENIEDGDTDTGTSATRQTIKGVLLWRRIVAGILFPLMVAVPRQIFIAFILPRHVSANIWKEFLDDGAHLWRGILFGILLPDDIGTSLLFLILIVLGVTASDVHDTFADGALFWIGFIASLFSPIDCAFITMILDVARVKASHIGSIDTCVVLFWIVLVAGLLPVAYVFLLHLDTMKLALPFPPRECGVCLESLALVGPPIVNLGPCGHCLHKSCFDDWRMECVRGNRATNCPCCNQVATSLFESKSDENTENGDGDTGTPATRQAIKEALSWRRIVADIFLPLMMAGPRQTFYAFLLRRKLSDDMWEVVAAFGGAHLWIGTFTGILFPEDIANFLMPLMLIVLQVKRSDAWDIVASRICLCIFTGYFFYDACPFLPLMLFAVQVRASNIGDIVAGGTLLWIGLLIGNIVADEMLLWIGLLAGLFLSIACSFFLH